MDRKKTGIMRYLKASIFFLCIIFFVKILVMDIKAVKGISMYPTLNYRVSNDIIFLNKWISIKGDYNYGDVVVVKKEDETEGMIIKRIIGLEGDTINIKNGKVYRNGVQLNESYLKKGATTWPMDTYNVGEGEVFVLGDNREESMDSRNYGSFRISDVVGKAVYRVNIWKFDGNKL